jgi:hypothetical protein
MQIKQSNGTLSESRARLVERAFHRRGLVKKGVGSPDHFAVITSPQPHWRFLIVLLCAT